MTKQKVLNIQIGAIYDPNKKKQVPVTIPAYPKKNKDGSTRYDAINKIFVNEMEVKEQQKEKEDGL